MVCYSPVYVCGAFNFFFKTKKEIKLVNTKRDSELKREEETINLEQIFLENTLKFSMLPLQPARCCGLLFCANKSATFLCFICLLLFRLLLFLFLLLLFCVILKFYVFIFVVHKILLFLLIDEFSNGQEIFPILKT